MDSELIGLTAILVSFSRIFSNLTQVELAIRESRGVLPQIGLGTHQLTDEILRSDSGNSKCSRKTQNKLSVLRLRFQ